MIAVFYQVNDIEFQQVLRKMFLGAMFVAIPQIGVRYRNCMLFVCDFPNSPLTLRICGNMSVPLFMKGDLYGGSHYSRLCSSTMTPQGRAVHDATTKFGDGKTLPFTPCKKGYIPFHVKTGERLCACLYHNKARRKRLIRKKGLFAFRAGEVDLRIFWNYCDRTDPSDKTVPTANVPSSI